MKRIIMLTFLILAIFSAGCTEEQNDTTDISDDALITHLRYGAFTLPEMAVSELIVTSTAVNLSYYNYQDELTARYVRPLDEETRNEVLELLENNSFLEMDDLYEPEDGQPIVADTGILEISVIQNGMTKTVKVDPYAHFYMPDELVEIDEALMELRNYAIAIPEEEARSIAEEWIMNAPTYSFDGSGLELQDHQFSEQKPEKHVMTYSFTSTHGGYGNRSDQMVTEVLTDHSILVELYKGEVDSAIIDDSWDEVNQRMLDEVITMQSYEMDCNGTPWQYWYAEGDVNFLKEPTEEELVITYFSTMYEIEITDFSSEQLEDGKCQYTMKIEQRYSGILEDMGWQEI